MNDGRAVANLILDLADQEGMSLSNLALQKILFFCNGWAVARLGGPLIKQEFEAWQYGPVLPHVYREFKGFDRSGITSRAKRLNPVSGNYELATAELSGAALQLVRQVVSFYGRLRPGTLVEMSHAADGPWAAVWNHSGRINPGMRIERGEVESYFRNLRAPF